MFNNTTKKNKCLYKITYNKKIQKYPSLCVLILQSEPKVRSHITTTMLLHKKLPYKHDDRYPLLIPSYNEGLDNNKPINRIFIIISTTLAFISINLMTRLNSMRENAFVTFIT